MMQKRVLILSASAGTGHTRAGAALEKVFATDPRVEAVEHHDALQFTTKLFRDFYSKLYMRLVRNAPDVLGWAYKASDEPWKNEAVRLRLDRLQAQPLVRMIRKFRPDITICTHFMPTGIMAHLIQKGLVDAQLSIVVTDLDMHAMWLSRTFHRYFVMLEETKAFMQTVGVPGEQITVSGIPIDPVFSEPVNRTEVLRGMGLDPALPTILFSAGAFGVSPAEFVVGRLMRLRHAVQTIVVCGRSEEARQRVLRVTGENHPRIRVLGFTDRMHELMKSTDLFVGKPGGLTVAEVLACGLPMVVIAPIPGQEERNSDHLLEEGVAIRCNDLVNIRYKIDRLLDDPARLAAMREKSLALGHPRAAAAIAETLLRDNYSPGDALPDSAAAGGLDGEKGFFEVESDA